jgi:hypothetical protein
MPAGRMRPLFGHRFAGEQTRSGGVGVGMSLPLNRVHRFDFGRRLLVRVAVVVTIAVIVRMGFGDFAPGAEIHPHGEREDHRGGGEMEVRLGVFRVPLPAVMQGERGQNPDEQRVRDGGGETQQHGLPDGAADGDDEGGHHRFGMPRLQPMQGTEQDGDGDVEPGVSAGEVVGEGSHLYSASFALATSCG